MILFVCHGNVARSQFAEALVRQRGVPEVMSAGTHVPDEREGNTLADDGQTARDAAQRFLQITGIGISRMERKRLSQQMVDRATRIIVMTDPSHLPGYVAGASDKVEFWGVDDPHGMDAEGYRVVIDDIRGRVEALLRTPCTNGRSGQTAGP